MGYIQGRSGEEKKLRRDCSYADAPRLASPAHASLLYYGGEGGFKCSFLTCWYEKEEEERGGERRGPQRARCLGDGKKKKIVREDLNNAEAKRVFSQKSCGNSLGLCISEHTRVVFFNSIMQQISFSMPQFPTRNERLTSFFSRQGASHFPLFLWI